jgi:small subunit ribosomal protein S20
MPNLQSSIKDVRRTKGRTIRNQAKMSRIETAMRAVRGADSAAAAATAFKEASTLLDRAAHSNLLHWRTVARQKSRLSALIHKKYPAQK